MVKSLLWKVCGMRETENIKAILALSPNYMGFIFYKKSPRFTAELLDTDLLKNFPKETSKVGVFVNEKASEVIRLSAKYTINTAQLHGSESPEYCKEIQNAGINVMKAFSVDENFDFKTTEAYLDCCDLFLFDTKAPKGYGGHGKVFDWDLLDQYKFSKPFLLAGGIELKNLELLKNIKNPALFGIDVNSKFEIEPALKDAVALKKLKNQISDFN